MKSTAKSRSYRDLLLALAMLGMCSPVAAEQLVYSHEFRQGVTYCPASPPYDDWATFRAALPAVGVSSITVKSTFDPVGRTCDEAAAAQQIADALRTGGGSPGGTTSPAFSVSCNGLFWSTGAMPSGRPLCPAGQQCRARRRRESKCLHLR